MAEIFNIIKNSERVIVWLHREDRTLTWLAKELEQTIQAVSKKIKTNGFTDKDIRTIRRLGCPL